MKESDIEKTKRLATENGWSYKENANGHLQVWVGKEVFNYYPLSPKKTIYSPTYGRREHCSPDDLIAFCLECTQAKTVEPECNAWQSFTTNPAEIKHFYTGDVTPWDFSEIVMAHSDTLRIEARRLWLEAEAMMDEADRQDRLAANGGELTGLQMAANKIAAKHGI